MAIRFILILMVLTLVACGDEKQATFSVEPATDTTSSTTTSTEPSATSASDSAASSDEATATSAEPADESATPEPDDPVAEVTIDAITADLGLDRFNWVNDHREDELILADDSRIFFAEKDLLLTDDEELQTALQAGSVGASELGIDPIELVAPNVPGVALPDLTQVTEVGEVIRADLGSFAGSGIEVAGATCESEGGELAYQNGDSFLSEGLGDTEIYTDDTSGQPVEVVRNPDGSGTYSSYNTTTGVGLDVEVNADGSGVYEWSDNPSVITVEVASDRTGAYVRNVPSRITEITLRSDGSGLYSFNESAAEGFDGGFVNVIARPDGTGLAITFVSSTGLGRDFHRIADGGFAVTNAVDGHRVELVANPDGSGLLVDTRRELFIVVTRDGQGFAQQGGTLEPWTAFSTDVGITDPALVSFGPLPEFTVQGAFPPLDTLPPLQAPCATVLRIPDTVLFDFDSAEIRPAAVGVLDEVAETLRDALDQQSLNLEVLGHTDAIGDDAYNLDLSQRRADAVRDALADRGVTGAASRGVGEAAPVAPNENADGSDNPAGRQQNRRVEIVIRAG